MKNLSIITFLSGNKMEDKKTQDRQQANSYSKSETYQTKHSKQKKRSTLVKRRNTAVVLSIVSSVILVGIGYEVVTSLKAENHHVQNTEQPKAPLRILAEEDDFLSLTNNMTYSSNLDFEEEINIIQQLTRHKNLQTKKIRELKEDLEESQARIVQLKTDILIKGGEKEQYYQDQINDFNKQLSNIEDQNTHLLAEVAIRDKLINSKRHELERLSKVFTDTHDKLLTELSDRESKIENEMQKTGQIFADLREELDLTNSEIIKPEDVRQALTETKRKITELERIIAQSGNNSLEANDQTEELAQDLVNTQQQLDEANMTINNLITQLEVEKNASNQFEIAMAPTVSQGSRDYSSVNYQQERLIKDLQRNLSNIELRNKKLEQLLRESDNTTGDQYVQDQSLSKIQQELQYSQIKIRELESELQQLTVSQDDNQITKLKQQISLLESTLSKTEDNLQQAILKVSNDSNNTSGLVDMEEFYETKLEQLAKTNQILEEQLEEAEEHLKLTQPNASSSNEAFNVISKQLQGERAERQQLEQELTQLRGRFQTTTPENNSRYGQRSHNDSHTMKELKNKIQQLEILYDEEQNRAIQLESQLETLARLTTNLQEEMSAHEASITSNVPKSTPSKLRAKIAYLTTRLAQEKSKSMNSEEKLQELMFSMKEVQQRNSQLEQEVHYR
jgi:chromosome segregation ATPase